MVQVQERLQYIVLQPYNGVHRYNNKSTTLEQRYTTTVHWDESCTLYSINLYTHAAAIAMYPSSFLSKYFLSWNYNFLITLNKRQNNKNGFFSK